MSSSLRTSSELLCDEIPSMETDEVILLQVAAIAVEVPEERLLGLRWFALFHAGSGTLYPSSIHCSNYLTREND